MPHPPLKVGSVVLSTAGRDAGRYFVVTAIGEDGYVYLADGDLRKIESPKRKKLRHIRPTDIYCEYVADTLDKGVVLQDAQVRRFLKERVYRDA